MKKIIAMTEQELQVYNIEKNSIYSLIRINNSSDRKSLGFDVNKRIIDQIDITFDDDDCDEGVKFSFNIAESIIRFCERQHDVDTIIITCKDELTRAYNIKSALEDCYNLEYESYEFNEMCTVIRVLKLKYQESRNWLINVLSPMEYCKRIVEYTIYQFRECIFRRNDKYNPIKFFWNRQCSIYLSNGRYFLWDLDNLDYYFGNTIIPSIDEIEYVVFYSVPEFATRDSMYDDMDYIFDVHFGIIDESGNRFYYDSVDGLIPANKYKIPEKYRDYELIQRDWNEFPKNEKGLIDTPEMEQAYAGMIAAEEYLSNKTGYKPRFTDMPLYHPDDKMIYSDEYLDVLDTLLNVLELAELLTLNELEYMCAYVAYIYTGMICNGGHCKNLTLVREIFNNLFNNNELLPQFEKIWKIGEYAPKISDNPIDILCIAIYSLIITVHPFEGRRITSGLYQKCLENAFEITKGRPELNDAVIMAGAFAGIYCQNID